MAPKNSRSRSGCLTCRQRKLKCSEERPACAQCVKAKRACVPSSGITFRHQQNPSMNGDGNDDSLKSFYGYKETFDKSTLWVSIPKDLTFIHTNNPYEDEDFNELDGTQLQEAALALNESTRDAHFGYGQPSYSAFATRGLEALSAVASQDQYGYAPHTASMSQHQRTASLHSHHSPLVTSPQHNHTAPSQNLEFILNPASSDTALDPQLDTPISASADALHSPSHVRTASFSVGVQASLPTSQGPQRPSIEDPELAFLLRDYAERPGLWMDLFDLDLFFAAKVPVLAVTCPLLLYSCASLSAKSLARVHGRKPVMGGQVSLSCQSKMEIWPGLALDQEGWIRKGREYYDVAVSLLRQSLAGASRPPTSSLPVGATPATLTTAQASPLPTTDSEELVAATAILCVYEFLDASGTEWSRHLDGAKTLFDITIDRVVPPTLPPSPVSIAQHATRQLASQSGPAQTLPVMRGLSQGRRAVFWNFARQDMLSAFINNTATRLDTADLPMWRSAGLRLTPEGFVCSSNPSSSGYKADDAMNDDMIGNSLVWLTMKLVNFIAAGDDLPDDISPLGWGVRQRELLEYWESLDNQLRVWHEGLPDIFLPTAIRVGNREADNEKWFPRSMVASTMQWFNFARIQLLNNKPHLSTATPVKGILGAGASGTSLATRYASYASILQQSRRHAKEIVAISLGRADEGTRIHSVQPLWTAGLVLGNDDRVDNSGQVSEDTDTWRRVVVALLRGIQRDMGWASEYRVESLLELWGHLPPGWPSSSVDDE